MRTSLKALLLVFVGFVLLAFVWPDPLNLLLVLMFGWASSAIRFAATVRHTDIDVVLPLLGIAVFMLAAHRFLCWLHARNTDQRAASGWRWRWTVAGIGGVWLVLLAIMSFVGVAHQIGWLLVSKEPIFVRTGRYTSDFVDLMNAGRAFEQFAETNGWHFASPQTSVWTLDFSVDNDGSAFWEKYGVYLTPETNGMVSSALVFPRDPKLLEKTGVAVIRRDYGTEFQRGEAAVNLVRQFQTAGPEPMVAAQK